MKLHFDDRSLMLLWLPDCKVLVPQYAHQPSGGQLIELFDNIRHLHHNFQGRHLHYQDLCKLDAGLLFNWNLEIFMRLNSEKFKNFNFYAEMVIFVILLGCVLGYLRIHPIYDFRYFSKIAIPTMAIFVKILKNHI